MSSLTLQVLPLWNELHAIQEAVSAFLERHGCDRDTSEAVMMGASELTENAIKYGDYGGPQSISLSVAMYPSRIVVEVRNPVAPKDVAELRKLDAMVQWIRGFQDPFQAYVERLKVVSSLALTSNESGLGLVRVAYEGQAVVDFFVDDANTLSVSAVFPLATREGREVHDQ